MKTWLFFAGILFFHLSCSDSDSMINDSVDPPDDAYEWIVPSDDLSGVGNPFPLAESPQLYPIASENALNDQSRVAVIKINEEVRIYPYQYISRFESVNENLAGQSIAITYCPITKSAIAMNREFRGQDFLLRASGFLYKDNLILVDQSSASYWSQMLGQSIKGPFAEERINTVNLVEMTFETARAYFPNALIFTDKSLPEPEKTSYALKQGIDEGELVFGVVDPNRGKDSRAFVFHFDDFGEQPSIKEVVVEGKRTLVIGANEDQYITAFYNDSGSTFTAVPDSFPIVMRDNEGNEWDVFGVCTNGPREGEQLESPLGYFALFWAWKSFFKEIILDQ